MTARDLLELAFGNLRRHRLRVFFTTVGVVIAIATFVALLSFAAGSQKWVREGFEELGLLTSMNVYPRDPDSAGEDSLEAATLDAAAVRTLAAVPGVRSAFPFVDFQISAELPDTTLVTHARALPPEAFTTGVFRRVFEGLQFSDEDAREAIVTHGFMESLGVEDPDSLVGQPLIISMEVASLDSALLNVVGEEGAVILDRLREIDLQALRDPEFRSELMHRELNDGVRRFVDGFFNHQLAVTETLTIRGVGAQLERYNVPLAPVIVPEATARRLNRAGFSIASDPASLLAALRGGSLFAPSGAESSRTYPRVTLDMETFADHGAVKDSVEALGFRAFSYAEQFEEIQRFHLYFYAGMGVVGFLALITAALGILNTLVMSVNERRKEIGVIKSLGAHEGDIRRLFLVESAVIGAVGSGLGIALGWVGTLVVAAVMKAIMAREEMLLYEPFAFPLWLILLALAFGIGVSVLAGTFPAARAARVDPVEALRGE